MDVSDSSGASPAGVERKLVAVLVCEIDEPTPLGGTQHDPDQGVQRSAGNLTRMQAEVSRHGGMVAEVVGDTLVALFGVPRTHDDDAERAVRTALAVRAALTGPGVNDGGRLRAGIAAGEAVVRRDELLARTMRHGGRPRYRHPNSRHSPPGRPLGCRVTFDSVAA
jgi:class 3 adenylate cyclase